MSLPFELFDLFSVLYLLRSVHVVWRLGKGWRSFWDAELTAADRRLARDAAFFLFIPVGVLLHEVGHTLATWQAGGQVIEFQWRVFWGYVVPLGQFSAVEHWWIALSGNLVSVLLGLLPVGLLRLVQRGIWKELLYAFGRYQLQYALVWYPAFALFGLGDWGTIYDFGAAAPYAQVTLAGHLALLFGLWRLDRSQWAVRLRLSGDAAASAEWERRQAQVLAQPGSVEPMLELADLLDRKGEDSLARRYLRQAERLSPTHPRVKVMQARQAYARKRYREARAAADAALLGGLAAPERADMHGILAGIHMEAGRHREAVAEYDAALEHQPAYHHYYWRAVMKHALGRRDEARADFEQAVQHAPDEATRARLQREFQVAGT